MLHREEELVTESVKTHRLTLGNRLSGGADGSRGQPGEKEGGAQEGDGGNERVLFHRQCVS